MNEHTLRKIIREEIERSIGKNHIPALISPKELAEMLDIKTTTLDTWRSQDKGPRPSKLEGKVMYKVSDVNEWMSK